MLFSKKKNKKFNKESTEMKISKNINLRKMKHSPREISKSRCAVKVLKNCQENSCDSAFLIPSWAHIL